MRTERKISLADKSGVVVYEWKAEHPKAVVLLVHGLGEHAGRYDQVAVALNQAGYALIGFDHPGHGQSDGVRGHIASYDIVFDLIEQLRQDAASRYPGQPQFVYGHSMGGSFVLYYLYKCQPKLAGAVVTSPGLGTADPVPMWKTTLGKVLYNLAPSFQMENGLKREGLSHDPAVIAAYGADPLVHSKISTRLALDILAHGREMIANAGAFPPVPLLLMQGSQDMVVSPQQTDQFAKGFKGDLTYKVWDGMYHELHNEPDKQPVLDTITRWLDEHTPG